MTLDPDYLQYKRRRRGMDHQLYEWSNLFARSPVVWPGGASVAVSFVVSLEWFPITPNDKPFRAPGHMQTHYPDYRHYTAREYGVRVGVDRLMDAFERCGVTAAVALNAVLAERVPSLVAEIAQRGHEIIAHSTDMNGVIATGLDEASEREIIHGSLSLIEKKTGRRPKGWLSIAHSQSWSTPHLLAEAGLAYQCDWVNDDMPYPMTTAAGGIENFPLSHELSDRQIINVQQQSADEYAAQVRDAYSWLDAESRRFGGRMLPLHITPYIMGLPYRMSAFEAMLSWLAEQPTCWFATPGEVVDACIEQRQP